MCFAHMHMSVVAVTAQGLREVCSGETDQLCSMGSWMTPTIALGLEITEEQDRLGSCSGSSLM